jgi:hypothetical protein
MSAFIPRKFRGVFVSVAFGFCLLLVQGALAQNADTEHVSVVGHLVLDNTHVDQMFIEQRDQKVFLYLHRPAERAYAIVDVTKPESPTLISEAALKQSGRVTGPATGSVLGIAITPENGENEQSAAPNLEKETIQFINMADPHQVKPVQTFKGVTAMYPDSSRKLVYLVNNDGLWIVSHHMTRPLPLCNSRSALTSVPNCQ